jgi:hypothetical protein
MATLKNGLIKGEDLGLNLLRVGDDLLGEETGRGRSHYGSQQPRERGPATRQHQRGLRADRRPASCPGIHFAEANGGPVPVH